MPFNLAVRRYVLGTVAAACGVLWVTSALGGPKPDLWALFSLFFVGCLLEVSRTQHKSGGLTGSLVFVFHLAVGLILGGFWGALTAGVVKAVSQVYERVPLMKASFNVAERVVSVGLTFVVYRLLGGHHPPAFLDPSTAGTVPFDVALGEVGVFLLAALVYFVVNSVAVNIVVALASERPIVSTWRANTVWVRGYDLAASSLAIVVTWCCH